MESSPAEGAATLDTGPAAPDQSAPGRTAEEEDAAERERLRADAPAFVPTPCAVPNPGGSSQAESLEGGEGAEGQNMSFRTPEKQRPQDLEAIRGGKGLHVDVPPPANNDVLRILDAVPFTPSQGIRTPSPKNMAALRSAEPSEFGPSKLSMMRNREMPSPPFSPTHSGMHRMHLPSPPFSPTYGGMPYEQQQSITHDPSGMAAAMADSLRGQLLHQLYFGFSGSPPSSPPSQMHAYHWQPMDPAGTSSHLHQPLQPGSPPPQPLQSGHLPPYPHTYPAGFPAGPHLPAQPQPSPGYSQLPVHRNLFADFPPQQPYLQTGPPGMGGMPAPPPPAMPPNPIQLRAPAGPQISGSIRRNHMSSRFRQGSPLRGNSGAPGPAFPPHPHPQHPHHTMLGNAHLSHSRHAPHPGYKQAMPQASRAGFQRSSADSTPSSSMNSSPSNSGTAPGTGDSGKPRMNARQRRTERRRREREIKTIVEHIEAMQARGEGLDGEDKRLFEFQLSEVQTLMGQVQVQQQDNGEGVLIEYHLRKLRSLIKMEEPAPEEGEEGATPEPGDGGGGSDGGSGVPVRGRVGALAAALSAQMALEAGSGAEGDCGGEAGAPPERGEQPAASAEPAVGA